MIYGNNHLTTGSKVKKPPGPTAYTNLLFKNGPCII